MISPVSAQPPRPRHRHLRVRGGPAACRGGPARWALLAVGLVLALGLPWLIYPPVAMDIAALALFAVALDLLLGYTGLLSFGHAAFWGTSAYVTGLIAIHGDAVPVAVLGGAVVAALLALPIGYLSVRRTGIYFAMVTLAFAQLIYFIANQWRSLTGGENGLQGIPRERSRARPSRLVLLLLRGPADDPARAVWPPGGWCTRRSAGCWWRSGRTPARARALGYPVDRYKVLVFVVSAFLAGIAGGVYAIGHGFASLQEVYWTTSGKAVVMNILGGMGTLWGPVLGAAIIVVLEDYLATAGIDAVGR